MRKGSKEKALKYIELTALKGLMREKKDSYERISKVLNIAPNTFCGKINGYQLFDCKEIDIIADRLDIDAEKITYYFFPHMLSGATLKEYRAMKLTQKNLGSSDLKSVLLEKFIR